MEIGTITTEIHSGSGSLFFYSYVVVSYLILLNMLLAIILDAYSEVKSSATASQSLTNDFKFLWHTAVRSLQRCTRARVCVCP